MLRPNDGPSRFAPLLLLFLLVLSGARLAGAEGGAPGGVPPPSIGGELPAPKPAEHLPTAPPDLGLRLVGTVLVNRQGKSVVVLEDRRSGEQGVYHEGDRCGDTLIRSIRSGSVVVDAGRGDEVLALEGAAETGDPGPEPASPVVDRKEVAPELPTAPQSAEQIRTRLDHRDGKLRGLIVYNIAPESAFAKMGLLDGDVILAVNGRPVTTTAEILDLYDTLQRGGTFTLEVDRSETPQELLFDVR
ncbi:MAG: PDZ domain-containing protein [Deltaproteobacteria bacterium]|nr:PDZ domain-containing protein [Deltaproteobacteria bacterium]